MWTRWELKDRAKKNLRVYYGGGLLVSFLHWTITYSVSIAAMVVIQILAVIFGLLFGISMAFGAVSTSSDATMIAAFLVLYIFFIVILILANVFFSNPLIVGKNRYYMTRREKNADIMSLFFAFNRSHFGNVVKTQFLQGLFICLWAVLCYVPGIIKSYEYRMIPYILSENPGIDSKKAFRLSKEMMYGNKWNVFVLDLSFIGWMLLGVLLCGIGTLFVMPYFEATYAELYAVMRQNKVFEISPNCEN